MRLVAALLLLPLAALGQESDPAALVRELRSEDPGRRERAFEALKKLGDAAVPELERHAKDPDPDVAAHVGRLLAAAKIRKTLTPRLLAARPGIEHRLAADSHAWTKEFLDRKEVPGPSNPDRFFPEDWAPLLAPAIRHARDAEEAQAVAEFARQARGPGVAAGLRELAAREGYVGNAALQALCEQHSVEALTLLVTEAHRHQDKLSWVRSECLAEALLASEKDSADPARLSAWMRLAEMASEPGLSPAILRVMDRGDDRLKARGLDLLGRVDARAALAAARTLVESGDPEVRGSAILVLADSTDPADQRKALETPEPMSRTGRAALAHLRARREPSKRVEILQEAIRANDEATIRALFGDPVVVNTPDLAASLRGEMVGHRDPEVRRLLVEYLLNDQVPGAGALATAALSDEDPTVRRAALQKVTRLGWRPAEQAVLAAAEKGDADLRNLASDYFARIGMMSASKTCLEWLGRGEVNEEEVQGLVWLLRPAEAVPTLTKWLEDPDLRGKAAKLLPLIPDLGVGEALTQASLEGEAEVREAALRWVGNWGSAAQWKPLRHSVRDSDPEVRGAALSLAAEFEPARDELLTAALADKDKSVAESARYLCLLHGGEEAFAKALAAPGFPPWIHVDDLARLGDAKAARIVSGFWKEADAKRRELLLDQVGDLRLTEARPLVEEAIKEPDWRLQIAALHALARLDPRAAAPKLFETILNHPQGFRLASDFGKLADTEVEAVLAGALSGEDPAAVWLAVDLLSHRDMAGHAAKVRPHLRSSYAWTRAAALKCVARWKDLEARGDVLALLDDPSTQVAEQAAYAAAALNLRDARPALEKRFEHPLDWPSEVARREWASLSTEEEVLSRLKSEETRSRVRLIEALPARVGKQIEAFLLEGASSSDGEFASRCRKALRDRLAGLGSASLARALRSSDAADRYRAVRMVSDGDVREHPAALRACLKDPSHVVRTEAAAALVRLEGAPALPDLLALAKDPIPSVRIGAARQIGRLRAPDTRPVLKALYGDPDEDVRFEAAVALGLQGDRSVIEYLLRARVRTDRFDAGRALNALNAFRAPEPFGRLLEIQGAWRGTRGELLRKIGDECRREVRAPWDVGHLSESCTYRSTASLLEIHQSHFPDYALVIDKDRIRLMEMDDAARFWFRWHLGTEE